MSEENWSHPGHSVLLDLCYAGAKRQPGQRIAVTLPQQEHRDLFAYLRVDGVEWDDAGDYAIVYGVEVREAQP